MTESSENNKRIAKNTLFLYFRMILVMGVTLYTSRVILESLGISSYGLYNVIGGVVALFAIISGSLSSAISRFLTYELGTGNKERLKAIFSSSVCIQLLLSGCIILLFTPICVWLISAKMNIPDEDYTSAYWVLTFSILTFCMNLVSVPYNAAIISHENMAIFSYVSIIEVSLKLGVAYLVSVFSENRVIVYAALLLFVSLIVQSIYMAYCRRNFEECRFSPRMDKKILEELGGFAGWNFIGAASGILRNQGNNVILNFFYGTVINAAYAIAMQVNNAVNQLADNFLVSVNPQITKYYATKEIGEMNRLVLRSAKLALFLTWIIAVLILVNAQYILRIWLVKVPSETVLFVQLIMVCALSESISKPLITAMLATGRIRNYQIIVGGLQMLNLPVSYVVLKFGGAAFWPLAINAIISQICLAARLIMLRKMISLSVRDYLKSVYFKAVLVLALSLVLPFAFKAYAGETNSLMSFTFQCVIYLIWTCLVIMSVGLNKNERTFIVDRLKAVTSKISHK